MCINNIFVVVPYCNFKDHYMAVILFTKVSRNLRYNHRTDKNREICAWNPTQKIMIKVQYCFFLLGLSSYAPLLGSDKWNCKHV